MTKKQVKTTSILFLLILVVMHLPFLPGPAIFNGPAQIAFSIGQVTGIAGLLGVPSGLIWIVIHIIQKKSIYRPVLFSSFFAAPLLSLLFLTRYCQDFSRNAAIKNGNELVFQIDNFKEKNGYYPVLLDEAVFEIPASGIIGVTPYSYIKTEKGFELVFYQNVLLGFNFEIVTYNNNNEHQAQGELPTLYPTPYKNWKYEVYD